MGVLKSGRVFHSMEMLLDGSFHLETIFSCVATPGNVKIESFNRYESGFSERQTTQVI